MELAKRPVFEYDVFLSFRGPDTRQGLTDVLFDTMVRAGIRVFKDDEELRLGDEIEKILVAVNNSQICVPIFSKTFAQSKWCLREVQRMTELGKDHDIAPIFYEVTPDDVELKTPTYEGFMMEHRRKESEKEMVEKWEDALKAAARSKGMEVLNKGFTNFCKEFVEKILSILGPREKFDVGDEIGLDYQVQDVMNLLDLKSTDDVRYVGIYGLGGIGKTTLAKLIYNKCSIGFDCCSFIDGVRESWERHGFGHMEMELVSSLNRYANRGFNRFLLQQSFRAKKVLIVLDDVEEPVQVEKLAGRSSWFAPGSRIIVTSRDMDVLAKSKIICSESIRHYPMHTLGDNHALQLFSRCAFGQDSPPGDFWKLSKEAISTCGGLPLALVIIGRLLVNKQNVALWEDVIAKSKRIPVKEVKERLKISYDKLDTDQQQIYLDIACFHVCKDKTKACYMWKACKFYPNYGLATLQSLSLIQIRNYNQIWMHDQLRDLGKDVVRAESIHPRERSRVWEYDEALTVISSTKRKTNVQGLCLDKPSKVLLTKRELASFDNLRLLQLDGVELRGNLDRSLPELKWLSLKSCSTIEVCNLTLSKLLILDLSESSVTGNWVGWGFLESARELRVLNLDRCLELKRTPCFPKNMILERLTLSGCQNLVTIDSSIGNLEHLMHLDLRDCRNLHGLPEEIGNMVKLNTLSLSGCLMIEKLPSLSIGKLAHLAILDLSFTRNICKLPESVGELVQLKKLDLNHSRVIELPSSIGSLESLLGLNLSYTKITELPESVGKLLQLRRLHMQHSGVTELPSSIGSLASLVDLNLSYTKVTELPESVGKLVQLRQLDMKHSGVTKLPSSIGSLKSLWDLNISGTEIEELPSSIGGLMKLWCMDMRECLGLKKLPESMGELKSLVLLYLNDSGISELPCCIDRLENLRMMDLDGCASLRALPSSISKMPALSQLYLRNCDKLYGLPELPLSLNELQVWSALRDVHSITKLEKLRTLGLHANNAILGADLSGLRHLDGLRLDLQNMEHPYQLQLPPSLTQLTLENVNAGTKLPCLSNLKRLRDLTLRNWPEDVVGFESLRLNELVDNLFNITLNECSGEVVHRVCQLKNLSELIINGCEFTVSSQMLNVSALPNLSRLVLLNCKGLVNIIGLGNLKCLKWLKIDGCSSLKGIEEEMVSELKGLTYFGVRGCPLLYESCKALEIFRHSPDHPDNMGLLSFYDPEA